MKADGGRRAGKSNPGEVRRVEVLGQGMRLCGLGIGVSGLGRVCVLSFRLAELLGLKGRHLQMGFNSS